VERDRDLRRFVTLCGKLGFKVIVRPARGCIRKSRFGRDSRWVTYAMPARTSDPTYLKYVALYWPGRQGIRSRLHPDHRAAVLPQKALQLRRHLAPYSATYFR